ncbi:MAG: hypothetical protein PHP64_05690 [Actinomycetota bacterium]|nr:hypothetical protein [Actinomycetota bacterium]
MSHSMGIDLHRKYFVATIANKEGNVVRKDRVSTDRQAIAGYLGSMDREKPGKAVMEACYNWSYLYDQLEGEFDEVLLAHPFSEMWKFIPRVSSSRFSGACPHVTDGSYVPSTPV